MIEKIFDAILALIFTAFTVFSTSAIYNFVKRETLTQVSKGLSPRSRSESGGNFEESPPDWVTKQVINQKLKGHLYGNEA